MSTSKILLWTALGGFVFSSYYYGGVANLITLESMKKNHSYLVDQTQTHYILAPIIFMLSFAVTILLHVPGGGPIMTVISGALFSQPWCTLYSATGSLIGGIWVFLIAKTSFGVFFREKVKGYSVAIKLDDGLRKSGFLYLVILRVILPFWLINIVASLFNVSLITFSLATFVGLLPRVWVYSEVGRSIGDAMVNIKTENDLAPVLMKVLMRRDMVISLTAFALLVIALLFVKRRIEKSNKAE